MHIQSSKFHLVSWALIVRDGTVHHMVTYDKHTWYDIAWTLCGYTGLCRYCTKLKNIHKPTSRCNEQRCDVLVCVKPMKNLRSAKHLDGCKDLASKRQQSAENQEPGFNDSYLIGKMSGFSAPSLSFLCWRCMGGSTCNSLIIKKKKNKDITRNNYYAPILYMGHTLIMED